MAKFVKLLVSAFVTAIVASCAPGGLLSNQRPYVQEGLEVPGLQELCDTKGGVHVYQTVTDAKGFLLLPIRSFFKGPDGPVTDQALGGCIKCIGYLARDGFDFVEAQVTLPRLAAYKFDFSATNGLFRYSLVDRESGLCEQYDLVVKLVLPVKAASEKYAQELGNRCIHAQRIYEFTAPYQLERNTILLGGPDYHGKTGFIVQNQEAIRERASDALVMESNSFLYVNRNFSNRFLGSCHTGFPIHPGDFLRTAGLR